MSEKKSKIVIKDGIAKWTERDWRGIIAIIVLIGLMISILTGRIDGIGTFGSLAAMVCKDYFDAKKEERNEQK